MNPAPEKTTQTQQVEAVDAHKHKEESDLDVGAQVVQAQGATEYSEEGEIALYLVCQSHILIFMQKKAR